MTQEKTLSNGWEVIHSYSRSEALVDGVLIDVTLVARQTGFKVPVALTRKLAYQLNPSPEEITYGQSFSGRLWDVLFLASLKARIAREQSRVTFNVVVSDEVHKLVMDIGHGDHAEPVITIGFLEDF